MDGRVVHDPEHSPRTVVGWSRHDLGDEVVEVGDSRPGNATAEHLGAVDIPGCDVGAGTFAGVFVLDAHRLIGGRCDGRVFPPPCLDAGFLVGAQDEVPVGEWFAAPAAFVQVEDRPRLRGEPGVAREHPTTMRPGLDGVLCAASARWWCRRCRRRFLGRWPRAGCRRC